MTALLIRIKIIMLKLPKSPVMHAHLRTAKRDKENYEC